jgi:hypothetical protein
VGRKLEDVKCKSGVRNGGGRACKSTGGEREERVAVLGWGGRENVCRVLDPNRTPRTLVVIIHEEAVNQFPGMAYFGGFSVGMK